MWQCKVDQGSCYRAEVQSPSPWVWPTATHCLSLAEGDLLLLSGEMWEKPSLEETTPMMWKGPLKLDWKKLDVNLVTYLPLHCHFLLLPPKSTLLCLVCANEKPSTVLQAWGPAGKLILPGSWPCLLGLPFQVWSLCSLLPLWSSKGLIWLFTIASRRPSEKSLEDALNFVSILRYPRARTYSHKWCCLLNYGVWGTWVLETNWMFS